ncbi:DOMON-like domain-containing protein [Blastomonas sp. AAP53]|uniref:DOMON-like domain-containing protein n=1 Tax=Blastomonas sp. AAP53 TaxID=1248760 RepID=UPI001266E6FC|nr:DOMON-like domain-containing protein [Blastomonas sp. AAP53]
MPHPDFPPPDGVAVSAEWAMESHRLAIDYRVIDPHRAILWPTAASGRTDSLWQHSCFEAFMASGRPSTYAEFNLAPSGAWAAYAFDDYRAGMRELALAASPLVAHSSPGQWRATLDLMGLDDLIGPAPWRLAITAVIEAKDCSKSYWSLAHPAGQPDFHHADCFAARLG